MSISATTSQAENRTADPIRAVSVVSTGTVEIHPEHVYGTRKPLYRWLLTSRAWLPPRPINVYVIEHAKGLRMPGLVILPAHDPTAAEHLLDSAR